VAATVSRGPLFVESVPLTWDAVGGMSAAKRRMQMAIQWPRRYSETWKRLGLVR